jgi:tungstate transport system permease protein
LSGGQHLYDQLVQILGLSLVVSLSAVTIGSIVGVPTGMWLGLARFRQKPVVTAVVHTGMALPPVLVGLIAYLLLSRSGPLGSLGLLFTPQAMILVQAVLSLPFVVGITMASVEAVSPALQWQIQALGASPAQLRWAVFREARSGILVAIATALGRCLSEVGAVWLIGGNIAGHTRVMTTAIVLETSRGNFPLALALGAVLLVVALTINLALLYYRRDPAP